MTPPPDRPGDVDLPAEVRDAVRELARTPSLLVASDYDGTLAPIVDDPTAAHPLPETIACVRALASLPATHVAVISGRALRDLAVLSRLPSEVHLVGSHGSEFDLDFLSALDDDARALLHDVEQACRTLVDGLPGVWLEVKPASVAVHVRRASRSIAATVLGQVREGPAGWPGVHITEGKEVLELAVVRTDKGRAVDQLRHKLGATAVLFVGDDVTDEGAFERLARTDLGVKVGHGESAAGFRVAAPEQVAAVLAHLARERRKWLTPL